MTAQTKPQAKSHPKSQSRRNGRSSPRPTAAARGAGPDGHIGYLLRRAQISVRNHIERALADLGVTHPQFLVLTMVNAYEGLSSADVARLSLLTPQTVNVIVQNLERDGLIERSPDPVHGRILRLSLSRKAHPLLKRCRARVNKIEARMLAGQSAAAERAVRHWLAGLAVTFSESDAG